MKCQACGWGELTPGGAYRCWLFGEGMEGSGPSGEGKGPDEAAERSGLEAAGRLKPLLPWKRQGFSKGQVEAVLKSGGKGLVIGVFQGCREHFGAKRKSGARKVREDARGTLHALRGLKVRMVN